MKRSLVLRRERLTELTANDLAGVAGGQYSGEGALSCVLVQCVTIVVGGPSDRVCIRIDTETGSKTCPSLTC